MLHAIYFCSTLTLLNYFGLFYTRLKVLFVVDEFNGFFRKTSFKDAEQKWVCELFKLPLLRCTDRYMIHEPLTFDLKHGNLVHISHCWFVANTNCIHFCYLTLN